MIRTYLNYFFSRDYIEKFGLFFSHFSLFFKNNNLVVEVHLYDGKVEDWIETSIRTMSYDIKRLSIYSLRVFSKSTRNVEFTRSIDSNFFKFSALLAFKLLHKSSNQVISNAYFLNPNANNNKAKFSRLLNYIVSFIATRAEKNDLVLKKITGFTKFFLRFYCLFSYQTPLYRYLVSSLHANLKLISSFNPQIAIYGVDNRNVTSLFISRFLARKLAQRYKWAELMSSLRKELNYLTDTEKLIYGYKIQFRGRFTRRSRSEYVSSSYGKVSTSTLDATIDYAISNLILRNGSGAVKVWLYRAPKFRSFSYRVI